MLQAFLFPGQGSQKVGMGKDLYESSAIAQRTLKEADETLGFSLSDIMLHGPDEKLTQTAFAQPAILTHSVAMFRTLQEFGQANPGFVAGHSLGEYSALVAASVLSFKNAVKAVHLRGLYMQDAVPVGVGAMAAVLQLDAQLIAETCQKVASESDDFCVEVANYNGPDQTVISGTALGVEKASAKLKEQGAKRVVPLAVSAPFHCRLMKPAATKLAQHLATIEFQTPKFEFLNNVTADKISEPERIRSLLVDQVTMPVRFTQILTRLSTLGVTDFVEVGPGRVLSGIVRRTVQNANVSNKES